jgi:hypothetical protein
MKKFIVLVVFLVVSGAVFAQVDPNINFDNLYAFEAFNILNGTIFDVFSKGLKNYDTDLKKKVFLQSDESHPYVQKLNELKSQIKNIDVTRKIRVGSDVSLSDYDINNGGFWLTIGQNNGRGYVSGTYKFAIDNFVYEKLPVQERVTAPEFPRQWLTYRILLKTSEAEAVEIEGNRNLELQLVMRIIDAKKVDHRFYDWNGDSGTITSKVAVVNMMKIVLYDKNQKKILFEEIM